MLGQRLLVAAIGIPVLLVVLLAGPPWLSIVLGVFVVGAAVELAGLLDKAGYHVEPAVVGALAAFAAVVGAVGAESPLYLAEAWLITVFVVAAGVALRDEVPAEGLGRFSGTVLAAVAALMLSYLLRIAAGVEPDAASGPLTQWLDAGRIWLLFVVLVVWTYDTMAYVTGRLYPRGHFFDHISPNKTWSGNVGGALAAAAVGLLLGAFIGRPTEGLVLGALVGLIAPFGGLAGSMAKRAAGVKDSSRLFPGHGGLLDRMDTFLVVAPVAWMYLVLAGLAH
jgi:phosphatidate cytidylyltransferase